MAWRFIPGARFLPSVTERRLAAERVCARQAEARERPRGLPRPLAASLSLTRAQPRLARTCRLAARGKSRDTRREAPGGWRICIQPGHSRLRRERKYPSCSPGEVSRLASPPLITPPGGLLPLREADTGMRSSLGARRGISIPTNVLTNSGRRLPREKTTRSRQKGPLPSQNAC